MGTPKFTPEDTYKFMLNASKLFPSKVVRISKEMENYGRTIGVIIIMENGEQERYFATSYHSASYLFNEFKLIINGVIKYKASKLPRMDRIMRGFDKKKWEDCVDVVPGYQDACYVKGPVSIRKHNDDLMKNILVCSGSVHEGIEQRFTVKDTGLTATAFDLHKKHQIGYRPELLSLDPNAEFQNSRAEYKETERFAVCPEQRKDKIEAVISKLKEGEL